MKKVELQQRIELYDGALNFACRDNSIPVDNYYVSALKEVRDELVNELKELLKKERRQKIKKINLTNQRFSQKYNKFC